jgi:hypothetical protein
LVSEAGPKIKTITGTLDMTNLQVMEEAQAANPMLSERGAALSTPAAKAKAAAGFTVQRYDPTTGIWHLVEIENGNRKWGHCSFPNPAHFRIFR